MRDVLQRPSWPRCARQLRICVKRSTTAGACSSSGRQADFRGALAARMLAQEQAARLIGLLPRHFPGGRHADQRVMAVPGQRTEVVQ